MLLAHAAGNRSSPPWSWWTTALTITPPRQLLNSHNFFILTNRFLPLWNQRKRACGPAGNRSSPFRLRAPQHHSDFSVLPNPFLSTLSQLTLLQLTLLFFTYSWNRFSLCRLWEPQPWPLHHHSKGWTPLVFLLYLTSIFHSETGWNKKLGAQPGIEPGLLI